ncbi:NADH-quinone oxidoreductase subunit H [Fundidesulfovibrio butyratiphilus]
MHKLLLACAALVLAPLVGGLAVGLDRKIASRLLSVAAPPVLQPFFEAFKLAAKSPATGEPGQVFTAWLRATCSALAVFLLFLGSDLLLACFVFAAGATFSAMAGVSSSSVWDRVRAREALAAQLSWGPLLILVVASMAVVAGNFKAASVFALDRPLLYRLPLAFPVLVGVLAVNLGKPPFDSRPDDSAGFSGHARVLFHVAGWYDTVFLFGLCALFWAVSPWGMAGVVAGVFLFLAVLGVSGARLTWKASLGHVLGWGVTLSVLNLLWLYAA